MKKVLTVSIISACIAMLSFSSCKKDYTCECTFTAPTPAITLSFDKSSHKDATDACSSAETTYKSVDPGASCTLK